jgi:hypothetical protein
MAKSTGSLWLLWGALLATLPAWLAMPRFVAHRAVPWYDAQTAVAGFVLAMLALVAGLGSLAMRESLVFRDVREGRIDPNTPDGMIQLRVRLFGLWLLCALVGAFGAVMAYYSDRPVIGWPYFAGSAVLFALHAPRAAFLRRVVDPAAQRG